MATPTSPADLQRELQSKKDEVKQLLDKLKEREDEIKDLKNRLELIELVQKPQPRGRGLGISAEPASARLRLQAAPGEEAPRVTEHPKGLSTRSLLVDAIMDNFFMKHFEQSQIEQIVSAMDNQEFKKDSIIIKEGDVGSHVYIIEDGSVQVTKEKKTNDGKTIQEIVTELKSGKVFGELAVMYNCKRQATVKALTKVSLWALSRTDYQAIMTYSGLRLHQQCVKFLLSVPRIKDLPPENVSKIADAVEEVHFHSGECIIRQGSIGDTFYVIIKGQVKVTKKEGDSKEEKLVNVLKSGDYFGERALESEDVRQASVTVDDSEGVDCYVLDRSTYKRLVVKSLTYDRAVSDSSSSQKVEDEVLSRASLSDFVSIATLGVGGFGRVELVHLKQDKTKSYALKKMKKKFIVDMQQQEHVMQEKTLLMQMRSPFIVRLHKTFKDSKFLYLVMEPCLGGELWTLMRNKRSFTESEARFYVSCVTEAYIYMHSRAIVYRDLKPENMMLDNSGYAKLVDFGFAKQIGHGGAKTWTFCGTPEYVAPEVILNKGHDFGADLWSLGILVFELVNGSPPFNGSDHLSTYNLILRGIDSVDFPKKIGKQAKSLIKKLCRDHPTERIGYGTKGLQKLQKHKWFDGFNWEGLRDRTLKAPIIPKVAGPTDPTNFDKFPADDEKDAVPDNSGWDKDF